MSPDFRQRDLVKCEDMRIYAERAIQYLGAITLERFLEDDMLQAAVVRCIEVIAKRRDWLAKTPEKGRAKFLGHSSSDASYPCA